MLAAYRAMKRRHCYYARSRGLREKCWRRLREDLRSRSLLNNMALIMFNLEYSSWCGTERCKVR